MRRWTLIARALGVGLGRRALTVASVAASALLALVLLGVERSVAAGITAYADQPAVDVWVLPRGQDNLVRLSGVLSRDQVQAARAVPGVGTVQPVLRTFLALRRSDAPPGDPGFTALALAMADPSGPGGPPGWIAGRAPATPGEIGVDRALAWNLGVGLGDRVAVGDRLLEVVGLSRDTDLIATRFVFLDLTVAAQLTSWHGQASFLAVDLPDDSPPEVRSALAQAAEADVVDRPAFVAGNLRELVGGFQTLQRAVTTVGLIATSLIVALLCQGLVEQRRRDVAVLTALGAPERPIIATLLAETAGLVLVGVAAGAAIVGAMAAATDAWWPILVLDPAPTDALTLAAVFVPVAALAASVPILRLRAVDPAEAFRP